MGIAFSLLPMPKNYAYYYQQISLQLDAFSQFVYTGSTCTSVRALVIIIKFQLTFADSRLHIVQTVSIQTHVPSFVGS